MNKLRYAIIAVDDDQLICNALMNQLDAIVDASCTVCEYFTDPTKVEAAMDELMLENIDIIFILVDYHMPKINGAELIKQIKLKHKNLKCVMLSGEANSEQVAQLKQDNLLEAFICKPWDKEELFATVKPFMEGAGAFKT